VIARLNAEINWAMKEPDVVKKMNGLGFDLIGGTPDQFAALIRRESEQWAPIIRKAGIKAD
jgi:tripartite-type tricarboxylate transporter receptor subunit TctC